MKPRAMEMETILNIAKTWANAGGLKRVELGALEPLLWRDKASDISDLVKNLIENGYEVALTTNGQLLAKHVEKLARSGLHLIRCSWHTTNPKLFAELSGGFGHYEDFMKGLHLAAQSGLKLDFNRLLLKSYSSDLDEQLDFLQKYGSRMKLLTLLWTEDSGDERPEYYQDWREVIRKKVLPLTSKIVRVPQEKGRSRLKFLLTNQGQIEVKYPDLLDRKKPPCSTCIHKSDCEEAFMDYVRVSSSSEIYFCYLRRDLGFNYQEVALNPHAMLEKLKLSLHNQDINSWLSNQPLRFTLMPICNFNCRVPGTMKSWCSEKHPTHNFPKMREGDWF
jgi:molybdenum cofactor biosynthesis enzyme MoaA